MNKHFIITKSTPLCQRLVAEYSNMETDTEELLNKKQDLLNQIHTIISPKIKDILAVKCFELNQTQKDIDMKQFQEFISDSLVYYIEEYEPFHRNGSYGRANFETYYLVCLKNIIHIFFKNEFVSEYFYQATIVKLELQRLRRGKRRESYKTAT